jgi:peptide/nickel transport system substrate-binding protein
VDLAGLTPLQYERQTDTPYFRETYRKYRHASFGFTYLGFNLQDARFADARVRRAFDLAVDKQAIVDGVLFGLGRAATGPYPEDSWAYNPAITPAPRDVARAKSLLAEAGWVDRDGDGLLDKGGQPFRFTLITNQGNEVRRQVAELVQRHLREVGVDVRIRIIEWSSFVHEFIDKKQFEACLLGWSLGVDPDLYSIFHSSKQGEGEYNFVSYANPEVDRLLDAGRRTFDRDERQRIYREVHRRLAEDLPYLFLFVPDALPVLHVRFRNVEPTPIGLRHNQIDWYVPAAEQRYRGLMER